MDPDSVDFRSTLTDEVLFLSGLAKFDLVLLMYFVDLASGVSNTVKLFIDSSIYNAGLSDLLFIRIKISSYSISVASIIISCNILKSGLIFWSNMSI